ncbi:MAG TPA: hypothetical protein GXX46_02170 [Peptococcaceae bacterium]|nr:hypothetical protein [Peptococcaceae bacterium]
MPGVRLKYLLSTFLFLLMLTACSSSPPASTPVINNERKALLSQILAESKNITELYYEEVPVVSHYSGGIVIENTSKVWLKDNILKTEHITKFNRNNELLESEITGYIYNYDTLEHRRYYLGKYPQLAQSYSGRKVTEFLTPREQTILWYLDKIAPELSTLQEEEYEGELCFITEILKNNQGSTKVWVSSVTGLPVKIQNNYNGNISERLYCNFKTGEGAVRPEDLAIPAGALLL